jgi:molecular chaperone GrpE
MINILVLYSEFENYRKRTNKERLDLIQNASEETIKDLLPVIDDYERALNALSKEEDDKSKKTKEGLILIYNKFMNVLEKRGLKAINAKGREV